MVYYQITSPYFCAAVELHNYASTSPILRYMADWEEDAIIEYCEKKGWKFERFDAGV